MMRSPSVVPELDPLLDVCGSFADHDRVADPALPVVLASMPSSAQRSTCSQTLLRAGDELLGVERKVDRFVRHPHRRIVGVLDAQPASDLFRRPELVEFPLNNLTQNRILDHLGQLRRLARTTTDASAVTARYPARPPLAFTSRDTVEGARPSRRPIARNDSSRASPREISSRSSTERRFSDRGFGGLGRRQ